MSAESAYSVLSIKELICLLLVLMPVTQAGEDISLEVTHFSPSMVELSCRCDSDWNMTDVVFEVSKGGQQCLYQTNEWCRLNRLNKCDMSCIESEDQKALPFVVKLDGTCDETIDVGCTIQNTKTENTTKLEKSISLTAQSDPPVVSINGDRRLEVSCFPVQIMCTVTNACYKTKLDIFGDISIDNVSLTHTKQGSRFTTTAISTAIFNKAGNYTIICKENGKEDVFSRYVTVAVTTSSKALCGMVAENGSPKAEHFNSLAVGTSSMSVIFFLSTCALLGFLVYKYIMAKSKSRDYTEVPLIDVSRKEEGLQNVPDSNDSLLWRCTNHFREEGTINPRNVDVMKSLIAEGANPFTPSNGTTVFNLFLQEYNFQQHESSLPSGEGFLEAVLKMEEFSSVHESALNDVIKSIPHAVLGNSSLQTVQKLLVKICRKMIERNSVLGYHVDSKGRTPLHNLMELLGLDDIWRMAKSEKITFLDLLPQLTTNVTVNRQDKSKITPYSWVLWWQDSVKFQEAKVSWKSTRKIEEILQNFENKGAKKNEALPGLSYLRKTQKRRNVPKLLNSLCGIWIEGDGKIGEQIAKFLEKGINARKVYKADVEAISYLQEGPNYIGYFAVISSESLNNQNFLEYLIFVLRRFASCKKNNQSTFVLVVVDKNTSSVLDDTLDKNMIKDGPNFDRSMNLNTMPRVIASQQHDQEWLRQIASKLQGPPVNLELTLIGNVGIGLAWDVFQYNFASMLPGIRERIAKYKDNKKYNDEMSKHYIVILLESNAQSLKLRQGIPRISRTEYLDEGFKVQQPGYLYSFKEDFLKEDVFEITNSQGDCYYACCKYIEPHVTLECMLKSGDLNDTETKKQHSLYIDTMKGFLSQPPYRNHTLVLSCSDVSTLPDDICDLIVKADEEKQLPADTIQINQKVTRVAEGLAWNLYRNYVENLGPYLQESMKATTFYHKKKMPATYFLLLPYSCVIYTNVDNAEKESIEYAGKLIDHEYDIPIYKITAGQETYFACDRYRPQVGILHEMETGQMAALTPKQRAAELRIFYEILHDLFTRPSAPDCCRAVKMIYYDDESNSGPKLSEILVDEIKESLLEVLWEDTKITHLTREQLPHQVV